MKKILSLVLAALMIFSALPAVFADEVVAEEETTAEVTEEVVEEVSEYQEAIDFLKLLGIYVGTSEDTFVSAAKEPVTRAQMALFTSRFITGQVDPAYWMTSENDSGFTDVADLYEEAIGAISFASQKGIVNGIGEGLFDPDSTVQYRDAITMIVRSLGYTYKASGYPWSYINKAREIGLLEGISGIGYTQELNREVVAQLLYNALFVEQDGTNVAEKTFNVGNTVVMITGSNTVTYAEEDKVARTDYVRFQELDEQGEPTGAKYHIAAAELELDPKKYEDDAAVGTIYAITYKNGCADILAYELLTEVYENRGEETTKFASGKLTIAGSTLTAVNEYTYLHKDQGTLKGADEVKLYKSTGKVVSAGYNFEYVIASNNCIYKAVAGEYVLYAQYSSVMDSYYRIVGDKFELIGEAELKDLLTASGTATGAFNKVTDFGSKFAYADFYATDANLDDVIDRVVLRQYSFGKITFGDKQKKGSDSSKGKAATFQVAYDATTKSTLTLGSNAVKSDYVTDQYGMKAESQKGLPFVDEFRWTGLQKADIPNNSYVLFYVDEANKEIDVLKVVDTDAEDGTYTVKGYLRGYNATANTIYMGTDYAQYVIGYDTLAGSPLKTKAVDKNEIENVKLIQPLINTYVELVIVDNKVVMINGAAEATNFVIIDSFVEFAEDGIVANAWSTVTDDYRPIKIAEFNGWNIGGFDYTILYLSTWLGDSAFNKIPVQKNTLYQVVYSTADDVYNLTNPVKAPVADTLSVNKYGYIEGVNAKGELGDANYAATTDKDYWMILVADADPDKTGNQPQVIALNGKVQPDVSVTGNIYKSTENDYVFAVADLDAIEELESMSGTTFKYVLYNKNINNIENQFYYNPNAAYSWYLLMQNVKTAASEIVYVDPNLVNSWDGKGLSALGFEQGNIYKVSVDANGNNVLTSTVVYDLSPVADYYANKDGFSKVQTAVVEGGNIQNLYDAVAKAYVTAQYDEWIVEHATFETLWKSFAKKDYITSYGLNTAKELKSNDKVIIPDATKAYTVEFIFNKDGKAFAWVIDEGKQNVFTAENEAAADLLLVNAGESTGTASGNRHVSSAKVVLNKLTGKMTVTITLNDKIDIPANKTTIKVAAKGYAVKEQASAKDAVELTSVTAEWDNATELPSVVYVRIIREGGQELYAAIPVVAK